MQVSERPYHPFKSPGPAHFDTATYKLPAFSTQPPQDALGSGATWRFRLGSRAVLREPPPAQSLGRARAADSFWRQGPRLFVHHCFAQLPLCAPRVILGKRRPRFGTPCEVESSSERPGHPRFDPRNPLTDSVSLEIRSVPVRLRHRTPMGQPQTEDSWLSKIN